MWWWLWIAALFGAREEECSSEASVVFDPLGLFAGGPEVVTRGGEEVAFRWTEGPVWRAEVLYFSDTIADVIAAYSEASGETVIAARRSGGGTEAVLEPGSNGMVLDGDSLVVCQHGARRVARVELSDLDGGPLRVTEVVAERTAEGRRLNSPNDVIVVSGGGGVVFTDPIYGLTRSPGDDGDALSEAIGAGVKGVYRVRAGAIERIAASKRPNGLATDPRSGELWVADSADSRVFSNDRVVRLTDSFGPGVVDGIKIDANGWLWATVPGGLVVVDLDTETTLARVALRVNASNLALTPTSLYVTGLGAVWRLPLAPRFRTAFFVDTDARRRPRGGALRVSAKTALLVAALALVRRRLGTSPRERLCLALAAVFVARVLVESWFFWRRELSLVELFAEAGAIIPLSLASLAVGAARRAHVPLWTRADRLGLAFFVLGTALVLGSELERHLRRRPGRLYASGSFALVRHPNYTGEIISFLGFAAPCGFRRNFWIPAAMALGMILFSAPELDLYLAEKYPLDWVHYAPRVPYGFLPYLV